MNNVEELHKLCEKAMESIAESNKKLAKENERLSAADVDYLDKLAHMVKSLKTTIAMEEYPDGYSGEYSGEYSREGGWNYNRPYYTSGNYYGNSGARRMRDSMGRYTSRESGYSRDASRQKMVDKLSTLLDDTMSDSERQAINECIEKIR